MTDYTPDPQAADELDALLSALQNDEPLPPLASLDEDDSRLAQEIIVLTRQASPNADFAARLEAQLKAAPASSHRRIVPFPRWIPVAAAALLVLVIGVTLVLVLYNDDETGPDTIAGVDDATVTATPPLSPTAIAVQPTSEPTQGIVMVGTPTAPPTIFMPATAGINPTYTAQVTQTTGQNGQQQTTTAQPAVTVTITSSPPGTVAAQATSTQAALPPSPDATMEAAATAAPLPTQTHSLPPLDVVFMIDSSLSMEAGVAAFQEQIPDITRRLNSAYNTRFSLVSYQATDGHLTIQSRILTADAQRYQELVAGITPEGDASPSDLFPRALALSVEKNWRDSPPVRRLIIIFTDTLNLPDNGLDNIQPTIQDAVAQGITIHVIGAASLDETAGSALNALTDLTGGTFIQLNPVDDANSNGSGYTLDMLTESIVEIVSGSGGEG